MDVEWSTQYRIFSQGAPSYKDDVDTIIKVNDDHIDAWQSIQSHHFSPSLSTILLLSHSHTPDVLYPPHTTPSHHNTTNHHPSHPRQTQLPHHHSPLRQRLQNVYSTPKARNGLL